MRIWEPDELAVVLGASGRRRDDVKVDACRADGVAVARRSSGGGTVVIGPGTLNVAVVLPQSRRAGPGGGRRRAGVRPGPDRAGDPGPRARRRTARLGRPDPRPSQVLGQCPARLRTHFLVHATLMYQFPRARVERYTHPPRRQPSYRESRSHGDFLVNLDLPRATLVEAIRSAWLPPGLPPGTADVPEDLVRELVRTRFADPAWIDRL